MKIPRKNGMRSGGRQLIFCDIHPNEFTMKRVIAMFLCALIPAVSTAQSLQPIGLSSHTVWPSRHGRLQPPLSRSTLQTQSRRVWAQDEGGTPRWVKWGLVGAVGGALLFAFAGQSSGDSKHSALGDAAYGAATGFVIIGGAVWLYDRLCSRGSRSRAAGMCG